MLDAQNGSSSPCRKASAPTHRHLFLGHSRGVPEHTEIPIAFSAVVNELGGLPGRTSTLATVPFTPAPCSISCPTPLYTLALETSVLTSNRSRYPLSLFSSGEIHHFPERELPLRIRMTRSRSSESMGRLMCFVRSYSFP
jgi:hypothetical protein